MGFFPNNFAEVPSDAEHLLAFILSKSGNVEVLHVESVVAVCTFLMLWSRWRPSVVMVGNY